MVKVVMLVGLLELVLKTSNKQSRHGILGQTIRVTMMSDDIFDMDTIKDNVMSPEEMEAVSNDVCPRCVTATLRATVHEHLVVRQCTSCYHVYLLNTSEDAQ